MNILCKQLRDLPLLGMPTTAACTWNEECWFSCYMLKKKAIYVFDWKNKIKNKKRLCNTCDLDLEWVVTRSLPLLCFCPKQLNEGCCDPSWYQPEQTTKAGVSFSTTVMWKTDVEPAGRALDLSCRGEVYSKASSTVGSGSTPGQHRGAILWLPNAGQCFQCLAWGEIL